MATAIPQMARAMREVLTTTADAAAKATQFVHRTSPLGGAIFQPDLGLWLFGQSPGLARGIGADGRHPRGTDHPPGA